MTAREPEAARRGRAVHRHQTPHNVFPPADHCADLKRFLPTAFFQLRIQHSIDPAGVPAGIGPSTPGAPKREFLVLHAILGFELSHRCPVEVCSRIRSSNRSGRNF